MLLLFSKILLTDFIAEMGDKTQLMLVAMTSRYKLKDIILGTAVAILILNGIAVLAGGLIGELIPDYVIKLIAALAFLFFSFTSIKSEDDDEEEDSSDKGNFTFAPLAVFCTFFVAELGDKTQLTALTFGANEGLSSALIVWAACSIGLFAADLIGLLVGYLLKSKTPDGFLGILAFIIFAVFGITTFYTALGLMPFSLSIDKKMLTIIVSIVFVVFCIIRFLHIKKSKA